MAAAPEGACGKFVGKKFPRYEVWIFQQSFFKHQCLFGVFSLIAMVFALAARLSGQANTRGEVRAIMAAAFMGIRWAAQRAKDQRYGQGLTLYSFLLLAVVRLVQDYIAATATCQTLEEMISMQLENAARPLIYAIVFYSFGAPRWMTVLVNIVLATSSLLGSQVFLTQLGAMVTVSGVAFSATALQWNLYFVPFVCCAVSFLTGMVQDQQARSLYAVMVKHQRECEHTLAATQRAVESEHRARELERSAYEESLQLRNKYVGSMSHDFGTPVAVLKMLLELMRKRIKKEKEERREGPPAEPMGGRWRTFEDVDKMLDLVRRASAALELLEVIRQKAIAYSKLQSGFNLVPTMANFSLSKLLEKAASVARDTRKTHLVQVEVQIAPGVADKLRSDEGWLFMVLTNLASNSIKHTPSGVVTLCASTANNSRLRLEVRDTGNGVPAHFVPQLFQAFSSAATAMSSVESTGLGLYHSKQLAAILDGDLYYRPNSPRGAVFTAEVPLLAPTEENEEPNTLRLR